MVEEKNREEGIEEIDEIKIVRGIKNGRAFCNIILSNGITYDDYTLPSNLITRVSVKNGISPGIFCRETTELKYGDFCKTFTWNPISMIDTPVSLLREEIRNRIEEVREWRDSKDYTEEFFIPLV